MSSFPAGSSPPADAGGDFLQIKIKTLEPATYDLRVNRQITVLDLKTTLEGIVQNAPPRRQRIIYRGQCLRDESTLQDLGVENGDTFHLVLRFADTPTISGTGAAASQAQPRFSATAHRILEDVFTGFNINTQPGGSMAGLGGRQQQTTTQQQDSAPHLFSTLHRFLMRLGEQSYTPRHIPLMSHVNFNPRVQTDFAALGRAMAELLGDAELPEQLTAMTEEARRDPGGRGPQQQRSAQGQGPPSSSQREGEAVGESAEAGSTPQAAGETRTGSMTSAPEGTQRAGHRPQSLRPAGADYGFRYMPLAAASLAELLDRTEAHVRNSLAQQLRQGAAAARQLTASQVASLGTRRAESRRLRELAGRLHSTAALLIDMSRGVLATAAALEDNPQVLAASTAAALRPDGTDEDLAPLVPRLLPRGRATPPDLGFMGPMGGLVDVFGAQFSMPGDTQGSENEGENAAATAPGARGQPPAGMAVGTVHIDLGDLPNGPGDLWGVFSNVINAVTGGAVMPPPGGPVPPASAAPGGGGGGGAGGAAPSATHSAEPGGSTAASGAEASRPRETPLSLLMPALTSIAGSIAASVMQSLGGRTVPPARLLHAVSRALTVHLNHVMEVLTTRWEGLQRTAARQRRAGRAQREQTPAGEEASAAAASAPSTATSGVAGSDATAAAPNPLEEFRPVAQLINQLFPSWETVLQVPAEPSEGDGEGIEVDDTDEDGDKSRQEGNEAQGRQRSRPGEEGNRRAAVDENMSAMIRTLMPAMLGNICHAVAQSILPTLMPAAESLDGRQLAMAVLQALVSRLDGVANMVLANWSRISSGLEEIESASEGTNVGELVAQMMRLAASIVTDFSVVPGQTRAAGGASARPPAARSPDLRQQSRPSQPQAPAAGPAQAAAATPGQAQSITPAATLHAPAASVTPVNEASTPSGAAQSPSNAMAFSKPPEGRAAAAAATPVPEAPDEASRPSSTATAAGAKHEAADLTCCGAGASSTGAPAAAAAAAGGPSLAPRGLGLGLRPPATKKKATAAAAAPVARTAAEAPTGPGLSGGPAAAMREDGMCADAGSSSPDAKAPPPANTTLGQQPRARQAAGANRLVPAHSPGAGVGSGGQGSGDAAGDPLDGLMEMMEHVLGSLDPREAGGSAGTADVGRAGSGGGAAAGGGLGNILQAAQKIVSDPAMQPVLNNVMNMVLGGGGGGGGGGSGARGGAAGGGLGSLLGSLLGGLPSAPSASSGSARSASSATERAGYEVLLEVLGPEEGNRWRELIERDVDEMQQHVQIAPEEHSDNYRRGVPTRRAGLLSTMAGAVKNPSDEDDVEDDDEYEGIEDDPEGHNAG
ncbi:hypothetical protein VaNZ11_013429 [Volvox africanus]|uniref:Ubiquitin-like domain-containing protein n=1 Tax=Volvox africanus TaxID=51714 RepID=A0ABQ5SFZ8_9CHLO|nr:hypothetical protein VaNZ11_013429 [Volvox africanus]